MVRQPREEAAVKTYLVLLRTTPSAKTTDSTAILDLSRLTRLSRTTFPRFSFCRTYLVYLVSTYLSSSINSLFSYRPTTAPILRVFREVVRDKRVKRGKSEKRRRYSEFR